MATLLSARGLTKIYQEGSTRVEAVKNVSLEVQSSEMIAVMGPSGSGKTTLLSMMGCILKPTRGQLFVQNRDVSRLSEKSLPQVRLNSIGFIFQAFNLFSSLTVLENVLIVYQLRGVTGARARRGAEELLIQVGLRDRLHFLPRDLSGGQKQRVSIARALAGSPPLILADEPTGNLDSQTGLAIVTLLKDMSRNRQCGVVVVTHDPRIEPVADRIVRMEDGILTANQADQASQATQV